MCARCSCPSRAWRVCDQPPQRLAQVLPDSPTDPGQPQPAPLYGFAQREPVRCHAPLAQLIVLCLALLDLIAKVSSIPLPLGRRKTTRQASPAVAHMDDLRDAQNSETVFSHRRLIRHHRVHLLPHQRTANGRLVWIYVRFSGSASADPTTSYTSVHAASSWTVTRTQAHCIGRAKIFNDDRIADHGT